MGPFPKLIADSVKSNVGNSVSVGAKQKATMLVKMKNEGKSHISGEKPEQTCATIEDFAPSGP